MSNKKSLELLSFLQNNPFVLAPMASITDCPFRVFMKSLGAGIVVSELISASGFEHNSQKTKDLMRLSSKEFPVGIQLFGEEPSSLLSAALYAQELGATFIDLNFGCPVPKVVKKGAGSALLKDLPRMKSIFRHLVKDLSIPLTIKIRTGWDHQSKNAHEVCQLAFDEGVTWVAIHGRTRSQGYEGLADWNYIQEVKAKSLIPVIGNGDVVTAEQAVSYLKKTGCDGIMIGRGALKNPFIFQESMNLFNQKDIESGYKKQNSMTYTELVISLYEAFQSEYSEKLLEIQFKKMMVWFATGFPYAAQLRKQLFQSQGVAEALSLAIDFFQKIDLSRRENSNNEGFLMGGHG